MLLALLVAGFGLAGGAVAYLTAPVRADCRDTLPGLAEMCTADGASPGRIAAGVAVGLLLPALAVLGRRLVR